MVRIAKIFRRFGPSGGLVLAIGLLLASPSQGGTIQDNFNDNFLNPFLWEAEIMGTGPTVRETNGRMEITFPADSSGDLLMAGVSGFFLAGDFDAQVDFDLLEWPTANGFNVSISTGVQFSISRFSYNFWEGEGYLVFSRGTLIHESASGASGKLRLKRTGTTMEAFYWQNNAWKSMGTYTADEFAGQTGISLNSDCGNPSRFTGALVKVGFDNFQVTNQYIGNSLPFMMLLLD